MIKILKSKNFINSVIVSLIIASFITFFYDKNNTERFYKKLEISNLLSQELLAIQKLKMAITYDPFIFKLDIFSKILIIWHMIKIQIVQKLIELIMLFQL